MIFNDDDNIKEFITYFYHVMPTIQTYVVKLTLKILKKIGLINEIEYAVNNCIITNRFLMFNNTKSNKEIKKILDNTSLLCPRCFKEIDNKNNHFLEQWNISCPFCNKEINLDRFLFYNYHKEGNEYKKGRYNKNRK